MSSNDLPYSFVRQDDPGKQPYAEEANFISMLEHSDALSVAWDRDTSGISIGEETPRLYVNPDTYDFKYEVYCGPLAVGRGPNFIWKLDTNNLLGGQWIMTKSPPESKQ